VLRFAPVRRSWVWTRRACRSTKIAASQLGSSFGRRASKGRPSCRTSTAWTSPRGDTLQTKTDERIFALGDCSDLAGADGKPLPSTAQVARQQALFLAKSLASHIKSGEPLGHFKYRDMGSLVALGEYAAYGTLGSYGFLKGAAFKGWLAHMDTRPSTGCTSLTLTGPSMAP
jgi:hypothetical protein